MTSVWKGLVLRGIGLFLFLLWMRGSLLLYIHERFVWLAVAASIVLVWLGAVYHTTRVRGHTCQYHHHGEFSWGGLLLVLLPLVFGLMAPRKPLGADALQNRTIGVETMASLAVPDSSRVLLKPNRTRTLLDWVLLFLTEHDWDTFSGEQADVTGFVFRKEEMDAKTFMLSRFVVTCCAADAVPVSLMISWPGSDSLEIDQWVDVSGHIEIRRLDGTPTPVLTAETVMLRDIPEQPYLYP